MAKFTLETCKGCVFLDAPAEPGEVSCREIGKMQDSLRCILYFDGDLSESAEQRILKDIGLCNTHHS